MASYVRRVTADDINALITGETVNGLVKLSDSMGVELIHDNGTHGTFEVQIDNFDADSKQGLYLVAVNDAAQLYPVVIPKLFIAPNGNPQAVLCRTAVKLIDDAVEMWIEVLNLQVAGHDRVSIQCKGLDSAAGLVTGNVLRVYRLGN